MYLDLVDKGAEVDMGAEVVAGSYCRTWLSRRKAFRSEQSEKGR